MPEEPERHQGRAHPQLDREEQRQQRGRDREHPERPGGRPTVLVSVHDGVDGEHQRGRHDQRARDVEPSRCRRAARGGQQAQREEEDRDTDGQVDEEDPVPAERVGEDAAEQDADRPAARRDEAEHAHRLRPLGRLGEDRHHQRKRDRRHDRAADPLHRPRRDEHALRGREAADERGRREERDPRQEQAAVAEEVAEPPAQQQEAAERQQVGVHDPRERRLGEPEILADRGKRDADDRHVEDDHQVAQAQDEERQPAGA